MAIQERRKTSTPSGASTTSKAKMPTLTKRPAQSVQYSFAKPGVVPPGRYRSKITDIEVTTTKAGEDAVDILYDLTDQNGKRSHVRMRYPMTSYYFGEFCDAMFKAGLKAGESIEKAIGVEEDVLLDYPNGDRIGSITARSPVSVKSAKPNAVMPNLLDDEDDEDFVEDDD